MKRWNLLLGCLIGMPVLYAQTLDNAARFREVESTTHTGGTTEIIKALDGQMSTRVAFTGSNYNAGFTLKFPYAYSFIKARIYSYQNSWPKDIKIESSANGSTYQTLLTSAINGNTADLTLPANSGVRYIRVQFNVTGSTANSFELAEFELIGNTSTRYDISYDACGNRTSLKVITLNSSRERVSSPDSISTTLGTPLVDNDVLGEGKIELYPNPFHSYIIIRNTGDNISPVYYSVFDGQGRRLQGPIRLDGQIQLDLSGYAKGIYFIRFTSGHRTSDWKIIKQ